MSAREHRAAELTDAALLDLVEAGTGRRPLDRALLLLAYARPDLDTAAARDLPLGRRDAAIAAFGSRLHGARLSLIASCPSCHEDAEVEIADIDALYADALSAGIDASVAPLTSADLLAAMAHGGGAHAALLSRLGDGADVLAALERADPAAEIRLTLTCPACREECVAVLDIVECVWQRLVARAQAVADTVAALAARYGWREADILAMSPWRRRLYLERAVG